MKKRTKLTSWVLLLTFLLSLFSCGKPDISDPLAENPDLFDDTENNWLPLLSKEECLETMGLGSSEDTIYATDNVRSYNYGNFVYYVGFYTFNSGSGKETKRKMLMRYNLCTGESYPAYRDSACTHQNAVCPLYLNNMESIIMEKNVIYILTSQVTDDGAVDTSKKGGIYSYNLDTLEYDYICERETGVNSFLGYYNGKLYYVQYEYEKDSNKHGKYIWSCDVKSGKTQKLFQYGDESDKLYAGRTPILIDEKGRLLFINFVSFDANAIYDTSDISFEYATLTKNAEVVTIAEYRSLFTLSSYQSLRYANGKLFFNEEVSRESYTYYSEGKELSQTTYCDAILYLDIENKEVKTLLPRTIFGFDVAGDYLYYIPYAPEVIEYENGDSRVAKTNGNVMQYNLKTGQEKEFKVNGRLNLGHGYTYYYRGRLFTFAYDLKDSSSWLGAEIEIDLMTGEYRQIPKALLQLM